MEKVVKLGVLLAVTDSLAPKFKGMITDYAKFFKGAQGAFIGSKSTYEANEGMHDEPGKRNVQLVHTTVDEKFKWFSDNGADYINSLFSQEKTNACSVAIGRLEVDGVVWGDFTSLELLRLKSIVSSGALDGMLSVIPVRSDAEQWEPSFNEMYVGRGIMETPLTKGVNLTTVKEDYILTDPNSGDRTPQVSTKTAIVELGKTSVQKFSGQWSQRQKASLMARKQTLLVAVTKALKEANDVDSIESTLTAEKIFGFLFNGNH